MATSFWLQRHNIDSMTTSEIESALQVSKHEESACIAIDYRLREQADSRRQAVNNAARERISERIRVLSQALKARTINDN